MDELARTTRTLPHMLVMLENGVCPFCRVDTLEGLRGVTVQKVCCTGDVLKLAGFVNGLIREVDAISHLIKPGQARALMSVLMMLHEPDDRREPDERY